MRDGDGPLSPLRLEALHINLPPLISGHKERGHFENHHPQPGAQRKYLANSTLHTAALTSNTSTHNLASPGGEEKDPAMSSSNPFRKKGSSQSDAIRFPTLDAIDTGIPQASTPPPPVSFRSHTDNQHEEQTSEPPPAQKKSKVVKKVRVLSPPPLSPDSPEWPNNQFPAAAGMPQFPYQQSYEPAQQVQQPQAPLQQPSADDPFHNGITDEYGGERVAPTSTQFVGGLPAPSSTSFSKALQDLVETKKEEELKEEMREEGAVLKAANSAKGSMDVDAFRRLLMTGNQANAVTGTDGASGGLGLSSGPAGHIAKEQDADSESDSSVTVQIGSRKKAPPPPPSSRHGKSIKSEADIHVGTDEASELHQQPGEVASKPSDLEAEQAHASRKSAPAPPPRRGHARSESKVTPSSPVPKVHNEEQSSARSSMEGLASKPANSRHSANAPLPPPPRRPHASHRLSGMQPSPTSATFSSNSLQQTHDHEKSALASPLHEASAHPEQAVKFAPPPPPARNTSVRRPPSSSSMEGPGSRQASGEIARSRENLPPPPPPARKRGSSKSSMDGPSTRGAAPDTIPRSQPQQGAASGEPSQGGSILADLDALQREVDALRGKT